MLNTEFEFKSVGKDTYSCELEKNSQTFKVFYKSLGSKNVGYIEGIPGDLEFSELVDFCNWVQMKTELFFCNYRITDEVINGWIVVEVFVKIRYWSVLIKPVEGTNQLLVKIPGNILKATLVDGLISAIGLATDKINKRSS